MEKGLCTVKKGCPNPEYRSKNVVSLGTGGYGSRFGEAYKTCSEKYWNFKCNDCGIEFRFYGES